jgi:hypothetical protein
MHCYLTQVVSLATDLFPVRLGSMSFGVSPQFDSVAYESPVSRDPFVSHEKSLVNVH